MVPIDTIAVENEVADNMVQRSELDWLLLYLYSFLAATAAKKTVSYLGAERTVFPKEEHRWKRSVHTAQSEKVTPLGKSGELASQDR